MTCTNKERIGIGFRYIIDGLVMVLTLGRCTPGLAYKYTCKNLLKKCNPTHTRTKLAEGFKPYTLPDPNTIISNRISNHTPTP